MSTYKTSFENFHEDFFSSKSSRTKYNIGELRRKLSVCENRIFFTENKITLRKLLNNDRDPDIIPFMGVALYDSDMAEEYLKDIEVLYEIYNRGKVDENNDAAIMSSLKTINILLEEIYSRGPFGDDGKSKIKDPDYRNLINGISKLNLYKKLVTGLSYGNRDERTEITQSIDLETLINIETLEKMDIVHDRSMLKALNDELDSENKFLKKFLIEKKKREKLIRNETTALKKVLKLISRRIDRISRWEHINTEEVTKNLAKTFVLIFDTISIVSNHRAVLRKSNLIEDIEPVFKKIFRFVEGPKAELIHIFLEMIKSEDRERSKDKDKDKQKQMILSMLETAGGSFEGTKLFSDLKAFADLEKHFTGSEQNKVVQGSAKLFSKFQSADPTTSEKDLLDSLKSESESGNLITVLSISERLLNAGCEKPVIRYIDKTLLDELKKEELNQENIQKICSLYLLSAKNNRLFEDYDEALLKLDLLVKNILDNSNFLDTTTLIVAIDTIKEIIEHRGMKRKNIENMLINNMNLCLRSKPFGVVCAALEALKVLSSRGCVKKETVQIIIGEKVVLFEIKTTRLAVEIIKDIIARKMSFDDAILERISEFLVNIMASPDKMSCTWAVEAYGVLASLHEPMESERKDIRDTMNSGKALSAFSDLLSRYSDDTALKTEISKATYYTLNIVPNIEVSSSVIGEIQKKLLETFKDLTQTESFFWVAKCVVRMASKELCEYDSMFTILEAALALKERGKEYGADDNVVRWMYNAVCTIASKVKRNERPAHDDTNLEIRKSVRKIFEKIGINLEGDEYVTEKGLPWAEVHNLCHMSFKLVDAEVWKQITDNEDDFDSRQFLLTLSRIIRDTNNTSTVYWAEKTVSKLLEYISPDKGKDDENIDAIKELLETLAGVPKKYASADKKEPSDYGVRAQSIEIISKIIKKGFISKQNAPQGIFDIEGDPSWSVQNYSNDFKWNPDTRKDVTNLNCLKYLEAKKIDLEIEEVTEIFQDIKRKKYATGVLRYQLKILTNEIDKRTKKRRDMDDSEIIEKVWEPLAVLMQDQLEVHDTYQKNQFKKENFDYCVFAESCKTMNKVVRLRGFDGLKRHDDDLNLLGILNKIIKDVPDYGTIKYALRVIEVLAEKNIASERTIDVIEQSIFTQYITDQSVLREAAKAIGAIFTHLMSNPNYSDSAGKSNVIDVLDKLIRLLNKEAGNDFEMRYWIMKSISTISEIDQKHESDALIETLFDIQNDNNPAVRRMVSTSISNFLSSKRDDPARKELIQYIGDTKVKKKDRAEYEPDYLLLRKMESISALARAGYRFTDQEIVKIVELFDLRNRSIFSKEEQNLMYNYMFSTFSSDYMYGKCVKTINGILSEYLDEFQFESSVIAALHLIQKGIFKELELPLEKFMKFSAKILFWPLTGENHLAKLTDGMYGGGKDSNKLDIILHTLDALFHLLSKNKLKDHDVINRMLPLDSILNMINNKNNAIGEKELIVKRSIVKESLHLLPFILRYALPGTLTSERLGDVIEVLKGQLKDEGNTSVMFFALDSIASIMENRSADVPKNIISELLFDILKIINEKKFILYQKDRGIADKSLWIIDKAAEKYGVFYTDLYKDFKLFSISSIDDPIRFSEFFKILLMQIQTLVNSVKECKGDGRISRDLATFNIDNYSDMLECIHNTEKSLTGFRPEDEKEKELLNNNILMLRNLKDLFEGHDKRNIVLSDAAPEYRPKLFRLLTNNMLSGTDIHKLDQAKRIVTNFYDILKEDEVTDELNKLLNIISGIVDRYDGALAMRLITRNSEAFDPAGKDKVLCSLIDAVKEDKALMGKHHLSITTDSILKTTEEKSILGITVKDILEYSKDNRMYFYGCLNLLKALNKSNPKSGWSDTIQVSMEDYLDILEKLLELRYDSFDYVGSQILNELCVSIKKDKVSFTTKPDQGRLEAIFNKLMGERYSMESQNKAIELLMLLEKNKAVRNLPFESIIKFLYSAKRKNDPEMMCTAMKILGRIDSKDGEQLYKILNDIIDHEPNFNEKDAKNEDDIEMEYCTNLANFIWNLSRKNILNQKAVKKMILLLSMSTTDGDDMKLNCMNSLLIYSKNRMLNKDDASAPESVLEKKCAMSSTEKLLELERLSAVVLMDMVEKRIIRMCELSGETKIKIETLTRGT